jgi:hypothetical protein
VTTTPDLQSVQSALAEVRTELSRADQKAATLLALFSAIAAAAVATLSVRGSSVFTLWNGVEWMAWAGIAGLVSSLGQLLLCIRPGGLSRLAGNAYFVFYAQYAGRPGDLVTHLPSPTDHELERCTQLVELSVLVTRKYKMIARAVDLLACSLVLTAGAALLDALH